MKTFGLEEAAEFLRISKDSMRKMADSGKVPGAKVGPESGRVWIFTDESLEDYLREEIRRQTALCSRQTATGRGRCRLGRWRQRSDVVRS